MINQIRIGGLNFHLYGLLIGIGVVVAMGVIEKLIEKNKLFINIWGAFVYAVLPALIGARIYHVIDLWQEYYAFHVNEVVMIWNGGMGIWGGVLGGVLGLFLFSVMKKISFWKLVDVVAIGLPLGQAIGRWGNFVNQELYGLPTNVMWKIFIDKEHRLAGYENETYYHPLFLYESLWSLATFGLLWFIMDKKLKVKVGEGKYFSVFLICYSVGRFFTESYRINPWKIDSLGLTTAQDISIGMIVLSLGILWVKKKRQK